jgi:hypothetical protein
MVGDPRGIFDQLLMPHPIHSLNIIIILIKYIIINLKENKDCPDQSWKRLVHNL